MLVPQLSCGSAGNTYPSDNIDQFIDNNKALIRRMYGELQEPRTKTTVRVVRTYRQERQRWTLNSRVEQQSLARDLFYCRFRRDVLEGTYEELLEPVDNVEESTMSNKTMNNRDKRQSDYPGPIENNNSSGK